MKGSCEICGCDMQSGYKNWHFICKQCGYEIAQLNPQINHESQHELINEDRRESGLRVNNFNHLIKQIKKFTLENVRYLLDVGCAHGRFLETAAKGFEAQKHGI